jgi:hypothetical protein
MNNQDMFAHSQLPTRIKAYVMLNLLLMKINLPIMINLPLIKKYPERSQFQAHN